MEDDKEDAEELRIKQMTELEQKGCKDWLAAAAQVIFASHPVCTYLFMKISNN